MTGLRLADLAAEEAGEVSLRLQRGGLEGDAVPQVQQMLKKAAARLLAHSPTLQMQDSAYAFWVPGRIEVGGKHTDYAGGRSLLSAVNRGFAVVAVPREDEKVGIYTQFADGREDQQEMAMTSDLAQLRSFQNLPLDKGGWAAYPAAAVQRLVSNFGIKRGAFISMECNLPEASGLSSSSAVICYMWMVLDALNKISSENEIYRRCIKSPAELYTYLGNIENGKHFKPGEGREQLDGAGGVGTFGGSEDHTGIMSCSKNTLQLWQFCPTEHLASVSVDPSVVFVIAVSGAKAEKTGAAKGSYNDAALLAQWSAGACAIGLSGKLHVTAEDLAKVFVNSGLYNPKGPNIAEVVRKLRANDEAGGDLKEKLLNILDSLPADFRVCVGENATHMGWNTTGLHEDSVTLESLKTRLKQFFNESESYVPEMALALAVRDYERLGRIVDQSHEATVSELRNTIPETAWLPRWARSIEGAGKSPGAGGRALAASAFGAGFGGSCWALVEASRAERFRKAWQEAYEKEFPEPPPSSDSMSPSRLPREFFITSPAPGAFAL